MSDLEGAEDDIPSYEEGEEERDGDDHNNSFSYGGRKDDEGKTKKKLHDKQSATLRMI